MSTPAFPIVIVGHVDHGKSTLIGRLLHDTGTLSEARVSEVKKVSARRGVAVEWSFALDALQLERDQAITVDSTQARFRTSLRDYVIVDAPGHEEFLRNMITGAAQAEAAVMVIDIIHGITPQTRRHALVLNLLGIRQMIVVVNKIDSADFDEKAFTRLEAEITALGREANIDITTTIPLSARHGDNLADHSARTPWWRGPTLIEAIDRFQPPPAAADRPFRLAVQDVYRSGADRVVVGRIDGGRLTVGDTVTLWPSGRTARIKSFHASNSATPVIAAAAPQSVAFALDQDLFVERGHVVASATAPPRRGRSLRVRLVWLGRTPLTVGYRLRMVVGTAQADVVASRIHHGIESGAVAGNTVAEATFTAANDVVFDSFVDGSTLGRGILVDGGEVAGGCAIMSSDAAMSGATTTVGADERRLRNGHAGAVFWLTGLSGAGKTTLARAAERVLFDRGAQVMVVDGDLMRGGLTADLGFDNDSRTENIRRVAEVAKLMTSNGVIVLAALISPLASQRELARHIIGPAFHEVLVDADVETCAARDVKGHYAKAKAGELKDFTGISATWERPAQPDLIVGAGQESVDNSTQRLVDYIASIAALHAAAA
ncbi:MAG: adenylyl-sulfate kinase [Alphaproteobacteria bacterium]|nr:adenylyl-sulfate kinase [Alphaproteobacteria bacterium]